MVCRQQQFLVVADALLFIESSLSGLYRNKLTVGDLEQVTDAMRKQIVADSQLAEAVAHRHRRSAERDCAVQARDHLVRRIEFRCRAYRQCLGNADSGARRCANFESRTCSQYS